MAICPVEEQQRMLQEWSEPCTLFGFVRRTNYEHRSNDGS